MHNFPLKPHPPSCQAPLAAAPAVNLFPRLPELSKRALLAAYKQGDPTQADIDAFTERFHTPANIMSYACHARLVEVVVELLDLGVSPTIVGLDADPRFYSRKVIPLACVARDEANDDEKNERAVRIADILLSRGADPNYVTPGNHVESPISAMHAACSTPWLLKKLIDHGGDVKVVSSEGRTILDQWVWHMYSPQKERVASGLEGLDILVKHGLPLALKDGSSFLATCWGSGFLRKQIPSFIEQGFDPYERGTAKGAAGSSLVEHLTRKVKAGKGGALAGKLLSEINANILADATPQARATNSSPRL